ncbi:MAG: hypothetical protein ABSG25_10515 [Bryobacteraceae bacterium]
MNETIVVALIAASGSIFVVALTFSLAKWNERTIQLRNEKWNHYKVLFSALSDLALDGTDKDDANRRFSRAVNMTALAAPQCVINALMAYYGEIEFSNPSRSPGRDAKLLKELLLAVRRDIGLAKGDDRETFNFHLIGSAPKAPPNQEMQRTTHPR